VSWFRRKHAAAAPTGAAGSVAVAAPAAALSRQPAPSGGFAVLDVETTGLWPTRCRIVEVAVVALDADCRPVGEFVSLVNPGSDVGPTHIHGIRARDVAAAPTFADLAPTLLAALSGRVPVAHNASFDMRFLAEELQRMELEFADEPVVAMCTMQMAPSYLPSLPARSLAGCAHAAGLRQTHAHSALDDARVTAQLLAHYRSQHRALPPSWQDNLRAAAAYRWPQLTPTRATPVTRSQAAHAQAVEVPYLARLVATLPRTGGQNPSVQSYLAVLDRALEDRLVTEQEAAELAGLAADLRLSAEQVTGAHRDYLSALAAAALEDGLVTAAERADLQTATHLLGLSDDDLHGALRAAADSRAASVSAGSAVGPAGAGGRLSVGDRVVITGETLLMSRQQMESATVAAGLRLVSSVSGRTTVLVVADPYTQSNKARRARELGVRILGEAAYLQLLGQVQPAAEPTVPADGSATAGTTASTTGVPAQRRPARQASVTAARSADGPLAGSKYLLVGFAAEQREQLTAQLTAAGGAVGAYVKASLAGVLAAPGAEQSEQILRCVALGVPVVTAAELLGEDPIRA